VALEATTDEAKAQRANGQVFYKGKWMKPEARAKAIKKDTETRKSEIAEAKAHAEWRNRYRFESKYFRFESTLSQAQNERYATLLDAYFEVFKKDWGVSVPKDWGKLKVCIYPDYESFLRGSGASNGVGAYYKFVPNPDRELNFFNDRTDPRLTEMIMFHECNHYLTDLGSDGLRYPMWIGESLAEYYGASIYDPRSKTVKFGQVQEGRLAEIRADIEGGKKIGLLDLIAGEARYESYTWGWSFFHFLMETPAYQKKFKQFFVDLAHASDVKRQPWGGGNNFKFTVVADDESLRVFKKRMGLPDAAAFEKLQAEWYAYVDKLEATNVRGYEQAGKKAYQNGMRLRAIRLLKIAMTMGSRDPVSYLDLSRCLRAKPETLPEAFETMKKACEIDPLNADVWAERGFVVQLMGQKDEGKKLVDLAYELDPGGYFVDYQTLLLQAAEAAK
jgi:hypothetical protein